MATFNTAPSFLLGKCILSKLVGVTFIKEFAGFNAGESASFYEDRAAALVKKKVAVPYAEPSQAAEKEAAEKEAAEPAKPAKKTKKTVAEPAKEEPCPAVESLPENAF